MQAPEATIGILAIIMTWEEVLEEEGICTITDRISKRHLDHEAGVEKDPVDTPHTQIEIVTINEVVGAIADGLRLRARRHPATLDLMRPVKALLLLKPWNPFGLLGLQRDMVHLGLQRE